jgi:uncharacterized protein
LLSCDTNILVYAYNESAAKHKQARAFLEAQLSNDNFALSELVLLEFYVIIRNRAVFEDPFSPSEAVEIIQELRGNPKWTILKATTDVSDQVWAAAASKDFPRLMVFDARIAYSLKAEGVKRLATNNLKHFERLGVLEAFDPLDSQPL